MNHFDSSDLIDALPQTDVKKAASRRITFISQGAHVRNRREVIVTQALRSELANRFLIQPLGRMDHAGRGMTDKLNEFIAANTVKLRSEGIPKLDLKPGYSDFAPYQS